ncbi:MAG: hypothetical protein JXB60_00295 [Candidatus Cloacimonetes bacterium]|nr:hypothetical protein [Candidatus Cloacimonadota bacterium]
MKKIWKFMLLMAIMLSLFLSACAPPPPPVSKDQLDTSDTEAIEAEGRAKELETEMKSLETEVSIKKAELESLERYKQQLMEE